MDNKITVYTDGSCHNASKSKGGCGVFMQWNGRVKRISAGRWDNTTNNRAELRAVILALRAIKIKRGYQIEIISDSQYVLNPLLQGWLKNWEKTDFIGKKNADLWREFLIEYRQFRPQDLTFTWIKGHKGVYGNEEADRLAGVGGSSETIIIDRDG